MKLFDGKKLAKYIDQPLWGWIIGLVFLSFAFAYFNTYVAVNHAEFPPIGGDVHNIIQIIQKYDDPTLFSRDFSFSDNGYKLYVPAYIHIIRWIHRLTIAPNYEMSIHYLMFPICFIFFLSMTWLLWKITGRRWLSVLLAFFSTLSFEIIYGNLTYSIGIYVTPRFLHLAITPLLFGLLLFYSKDKWLGPLIFLFTGLSSNLHFTSGAGLVFAFGFAWVLHDLLKKPNYNKFRHWTLCFFGGLLGMLPYFLTFCSGQMVGSGEASNVLPEAFNAMLRTRLAFYPMDIFAVQLQWSSWVVMIIKIFLYVYPVFVLGNLILRYIGHQRIAYFLLYFSNLIFMIIVAADESKAIISAIIIPAFLLGIYDFKLRRELDSVRIVLVYFVSGLAFIGVLFSVWVVDIVQWLNLYMPSFYYDFGSAVKYMPFVLNIYGVVMMAEVVPLIRVYSRSQDKSTVIKSVRALIVLVLLIGCLGFRFWQASYNGYGYYRSNGTKVLLGQKIFNPSPVQLDYREATNWIKTHTPKDALFLVLNEEPHHDFMFRYKSQRSMWVCEKDGGISFYKGRDIFVRWYREFQAKEQILKERNLQGLKDYISSRKTDYLFIDKNNYNWIPTSGIKNSEIVFENSSYTVLKQ